MKKQRSAKIKFTTLPYLVTLVLSSPLKELKCTSILYILKVRDGERHIYVPSEN